MNTLVPLRFGATSVIKRLLLLNSASDIGAGVLALTKDSAGLIISTISDTEATPTVYTQAAGNIETIATLGTYAAPTASKCRFKLVDDTNHPGLYEFQFADARFAVAGSKCLMISITGPAALNLQMAIYCQPLWLPEEFAPLGTYPTATVATDGGNSATAFKTTRTEATNDYWKDVLLRFTSGALIGQTKKVTTYAGATKIITVSGGFTGTPADGVGFVLVNI